MTVTTPIGDRHPEPLGQQPVTDYGLTVPTSRKTPQRTVAIDDELWERVRQIAATRRETISEVIRRALVAYETEHRKLLADDSGD